MSRNLFGWEARNRIELALAGVLLAVLLFFVMIPVHMIISLAINMHWRRVGGGDGFSGFNDPSDFRYGYSMSQQGNLLRFDKATGERVGLHPAHPDGEYLRFNWNAALNVDPFDPSVLYLGSQFVHRTRDQGKSWEIISPDLTTNEPEKQKFQCCWYTPRNNSIFFDVSAGRLLRRFTPNSSDWV